MKNLKAIFISAIITLLAFGAITYTSCTKDPCSGVNCLNGGTCSGGSCSCPTGFTGPNCGETTITYYNDTYTPVLITAGGITSTIAVGNSLTIAGPTGNSLDVTASTSGTTSSGTQLGDLITWNNLSSTFPSIGNTEIDIDVSSDYFFLNVKNTNGTNTITSIYVNYGLTYQTEDGVTIPNDGQLYGIGYYLAYNNTQIRMYGSGGIYETSYPFTMPYSFSSNQQFIFNFSN